MLSKLVRIGLALTLMALPLAAFADTKAVAAAKEAVRRAVRNKLGAANRVVFVDANEKFLSISEVTVSGTGHVSEGAGWRIERSFTFSVKVKRDGSQTRDVRLTLSDGQDVVDGPGWENANPGDDFVHVSRPSWYQRLNSNNVTFEGKSKGEVTISVFDQNNRKVAEGKVKPSNGTFRTTLNVPNGLHRAVIQPTLSFDWDEVRFSVRSSSNDWGLPGTKPTPGVENIVQVDSPGNNGTVTGPRVTISGTCTERSVSLEAFDSRNNRVLRQSVSVRNGRWSTTGNFEDGTVRLLVKSESGRDEDAVTFRVVNAGNPGGGVENIVEITAPRDGAKVGKVTTISGRSSEGSVSIQVYDPTNKLVKNAKVTVRNGQWSLQITLSVGGSYRLVVESASGRDTDALRFTVDPRLRGGR